MGSIMVLKNRESTYNLGKDRMMKSTLTFFNTECKQKIKSDVKYKCYAFLIVILNVVPLPTSVWEILISPLWYS